MKSAVLFLAIGNLFSSSQLTGGDTEEAAITAVNNIGGIVKRDGKRPGGPCRFRVT
jgi:hypothetical protein